MTTHVDVLIRRLRAPDQRGVGRVEALGSGADSIDRLVALDDQAQAIRAWDHLVVPGLLQTPAYSAAVIEAAHPGLSGMDVRRLTLLKCARAQAFGERVKGRTPPLAWFVVSEGAVTRALAGNVEDHLDQLLHLLAMAEQPTVSIQVLPGHIVPPLLSAHFLLYTLRDQSQPPRRLGFTETAVSDWYSTRLEDVARLHSAFSELTREAMSPAASRAFIREVEESWRSSANLTSPARTRALPSSSPPTPSGPASA